MVFLGRSVRVAVFTQGANAEAAKAAGAELVCAFASIWRACSTSACGKVTSFSTVVNHGSRSPAAMPVIRRFNLFAIDKRLAEQTGGGKLTLLGNLNPRDWPVLVNQAINRRAVPSFAVLSSIVYSCCKWCETASIKMPSHLSVWMSIYCGCCERRNDFVMQIRVFHRYSITYLIPKSRFWQKCLVITEKMISFAVE